MTVLCPTHRERRGDALGRIALAVGIVIGHLLVVPVAAAAAPSSSTQEPGPSLRGELPQDWSQWREWIAPYRTEIRAAMVVGVAAVLALLARGHSKKVHWRANVRKGRMAARQERFLDASPPLPLAHHTAAEVEAAVNAAVEPEGADQGQADWQTPDAAQQSGAVREVRSQNGLAPSGAAESGHRPTILCIDDDPEVSRSLAVRLRPYGVDVLRAFSGMQGFCMGLESRPDVIITDLKMPDGQGDYVFSRLKSHSLTKDTPIIVLTGYANPGHRREMLSAGVANYFTKPYDFNELLRELRCHIDLPATPVALDAPVHSA